MDRIKIMLADDHVLFMEGVQQLIAGQPDMEVVAMASNGDELLVKLNAYHADIVLLDIQMPGKSGLDTAAELRDRFPNVKVIALSMHSEASFILRMHDNGAAGYLLKNTDRDELLEAVRSVHAGNPYFGQHTTLSALRASLRGSDQGGIVLSKREKEILALIAREHSNPEIADMLHLSVETINSHRKNLLQKLGAKNTAGLVKYAIFNCIG